MTNSISIYNFNQNSVRTTQIDNKPWFCLADCRQALSIKGSLKVGTLSDKGVIKTDTLTNGGKQELTFINEPNLYRLIFRSNKPQAQAFADWVYSEVLPQIRKTGSYGTPAPVDMKAIGGVVKKCAAVAVREEVKQVVTETIREEVRDMALDVVLSAERFKPLHEVSDETMMNCLYGWYSTRHHKLLDVVKELDEENGRLKSQMAMIKKVVA